MANVDMQDVIWRNMGYGYGKYHRPGTFQWSKLGKKASDGYRICTPLKGVELEQYGNKVYFKGALIVERETHWGATWGALSYFHSNIKEFYNEFILA